MTTASAGAPGRPARARPARTSPARPSPATRNQLLRAATLGARTATADLDGDPDRARGAVRAWHRLRRRARPGPARTTLAVAYDIGYGRGMTAPGSVAARAG